MDIAEVDYHEAAADDRDLFPKPVLLLDPPLPGHSQSNAMAVGDTPSLLALLVDQALMRMSIEEVAMVPLSASMIQMAVCLLARQVDATVGMMTVGVVVKTGSDLEVSPSRLVPLLPKLPRFLSVRPGRLHAMPAQLLFFLRNQIRRFNSQRENYRQIFI